MTERDRGPWKATWRSMAPTKVKCFSWLVVRKACLTHEALQKRKFHLDSICPLCMEPNETNSHLFLHCKVTSQVWSLFITLAGESWTMPEHTADLLSCWIEGEGAKARRDGGKLSQLAYGGPYGRKGMREFSKEDQTPFNRSKGNAFLLYVFGVKSNV
uniref:Putative ovule protein n=1 Tax=Solanum chacoense TaxID=4108 RepID=A0A0V0IU04_SOLCH